MAASTNPPSSSATTYSRHYDPFHIPEKLTISSHDVRALNLGFPAERDPVGADVNALGGQPVNAPNHLDNAANGPHAPAAADGNAADRSGGGSAPGGTVRDQRGSSSAAWSRGRN